MEYTKDMVFSVRYGQVKIEEEFENKSIFRRIKEKLIKHKIITFVVSTTLLLIILDTMLIISFLNILVRLGSVL